jgi:hypothetical protein
LPHLTTTILQVWSCSISARRTRTRVGAPRVLRAHLLAQSLEGASVAPLPWVSVQRGGSKVPGEKRDGRAKLAT